MTNYLAQLESAGHAAPCLICDAFPPLFKFYVVTLNDTDIETHMCFCFIHKQRQLDFFLNKTKTKGNKI